MAIKHSIENVEKVIKDLSLENPSDIIADIMHYFDHNKLSFEDVLALGGRYYKADIADDYEIKEDSNNGFTT